MHLGKRNLFKGTKNIYIADIHSDGLKLEALIKNLKKECSFVDYRIVFLGDLFGKIGMNTIKVLEVVKELKKTRETFDKHKGFLWVVILGMTPFVSNFLSLFCGIIKYDIRKYILASLISKISFNLILAYAGYYGINWFLNVFQLPSLI